MTHNVLKVTNKETGKISYCLNLAYVENLTGVQRVQFKCNPFKNRWEIEEVDGSELKFKEIYMEKKKVW